MSVSNALKDALAETKISDILQVRRPQEKELISIKSDETLEAALHLLAEHNILSLPVFKTKNGRCDGLVDMNHIVAYMCQQLADGENINSIKLDIPVSTVVDNSQWDPLLTATSDTRVMDLLSWFASGYSHRAVVGSPPTVCSQSDVITYIAAMCRKPTADSALTDLFNTPAFEIVKGQTHLRNDKKEGGVATVQPDASVIEAMKILHRDSVSAIAVVDSQGKLIGNFSASDLRGLLPNDLSVLNDGVREFLLKKSPRFYPIAVDKSTTFAEAIEMMADSRIHRVWVVEDLSHPFPVDVITLSDVLKFVSQYHKA